MKSVRLIILLVLTLILSAGAVGHAQMASAEHQVTAGGMPGGGGASSSSGFRIRGNTGFGPMGISNSASYVMNGGVIASMTAAESFAATYDRPPVDTVVVGTQVVTVNYANHEGTVSGIIHYRRPGQITYTDATFSIGTGPSLTYNVSSSLLGIRGLEYYIEITDDGSSITRRIGEPGEPFRLVSSFNNAQGQRPSGMPDASYRIVGLPIDITGIKSVETVFRDDLGAPDISRWRLGRYYAITDTTLEYPSDSIVRPGQGYWLIARDGRKYGAAGLSVQANRTIPSGPLAGDYFEVPVDSGWNQVVNPLPFPVTWAEVIMDNGGVVANRDAAVITDTLYFYNGSNYENIWTLPTWDGVFIMVKKSDVKLLFPFREAGASAQRSAPPVASAVPDWFVEFSLATGDRKDAGNFAGVFADASVGLDKYDLEEPPLPPGASRMSFTLPKGRSSHYRCDYRPYFDDGAVWDIEFSPGSDRVLTVSRTERVPDGLDMWLLLNVGERFRLEVGKMIPLANDVSSAQLIIGNPAFTSTQLADGLPTDYTVSQNFPNPFNPRTTIRYAVPASGQVTLYVLNILGQRVSTLVDGFVEAGHHSVVWEGTNESGQTVASGVYFYRIEAGSFQTTRKMMLLK
jgi:hypothetical protein